MTVKTDSRVRRLFEQGRILELGQLAAQKRGAKRAGYLADDRVSHYFEEAPEEPGIRVHFLPDDEAEERLKDFKERYPQTLVHGLSVERLQGREADSWGALGLDSLTLDTGPLDRPTPQWEEVARAQIPMVASFVYGPQADYEALEARLEKLSGFASIRSVVALPASVGDRILLPGATTDGTHDMKVLSLCRLLLDKAHVRISWGVLGWKVAQVGLAFGGDELCGWGTEERLAFSHRVRPAARVETDELLAGLAEAGYDGFEIDRCDWV